MFWDLHYLMLTIEESDLCVYPVAILSGRVERRVHSCDFVALLLCVDGQGLEHCGSFGSVRSHPFSGQLPRLIGPPVAGNSHSLPSALFVSKGSANPVQLRK